MKTIYTISIFILLTLNAFNQNTKVTNTIDDKENAKKELNKILEAPSIDSVAFDKSEEQKTDKAFEEKPIYVPTPKPAQNANSVEVKSEPVPGAEIIIDNVPDTPKKKKEKNSANSNQPNQDNKKNDDNKPNL